MARGMAVRSDDHTTGPDISVLGKDLMADPAFIKTITAEPKLETLFVSLGGGMSITMKKR